MFFCFCLFRSFLNDTLIYGLWEVNVYLVYGLILIHYKSLSYLLLTYYLYFFSYVLSSFKLKLCFCTTFKYFKHLEYIKNLKKFSRHYPINTIHLWNLLKIWSSYTSKVETWAAFLLKNMLTLVCFLNAN